MRLKNIVGKQDLSAQENGQNGALMALIKTAHSV